MGYSAYLANEYTFPRQSLLSALLTCAMALVENDLTSTRCMRVDCTLLCETTGVRHDDPMRLEGKEERVAAPQYHASMSQEVQTKPRKDHSELVHMNQNLHQQTRPVNVSVGILLNETTDGKKMLLQGERLAVLLEQNREDAVTTCNQKVERHLNGDQAYQIPQVTHVPINDATGRDVLLSHHKTHSYDMKEDDTKSDPLLQPVLLLSCISMDNLSIDSKTNIMHQVDYLREWNGCLDETVAHNEDLYQLLQQQTQNVYQMLMDQYTVLFHQFHQEHEQLYNAWCSNRDQETLVQREWSDIEKTLKCQELYFKLWEQKAKTRDHRLELEMERTDQDSADVRETSSHKVQKVQNVILQTNDRECGVCNRKWNIFRRRLDALKTEMKAEQQRRKQLDKDIVNNDAQPPLFDFSQQCDNQSEACQLKSQVDALNSQKYLFMSQSQTASKLFGWKEKEKQLQAELYETRVLNESLNCRLETIKFCVFDILQLIEKLCADKQEFKSNYEDLVMYMQLADTELLNGETQQQSRQREAKHGSSYCLLISETSKLYDNKHERKAQTTTASPRQVVVEKNTLMNGCIRLLAIVRALRTQDRLQNRLKITQLDQMFNEENLCMMLRVMDAMSAIHTVIKSKQALQAAQERHDHAKQNWDEAEALLKQHARRPIQELQMKLEVLRSERNDFEARAGEASEENVLLREKEKKAKMLREALLEVKDELLKEEDRHAVDTAKAHYVMNQDSFARKDKKRREDEGETTRLHSQVQQLEQKLSLLVEKQDWKHCRKCAAENGTTEETKRALGSDIEALRDEIEQLKRLLKDKAANEVRAVEEQEKKVKALQSQSFALSVAATPATVAPTEKAGTECKQFENERKRWRRVEIPTLGLTEKQKQVEAKEFEHDDMQVSNAESRPQSKQARHEKEQLTHNARAPTASSVSVKQQVLELDCQNACRQESPTLKCKEWESASPENDQAQLQQLRQRPVQYGICLNTSAPVRNMNDTIGQCPNSRLQLEEQHHCVSEEGQEAISACSNEEVQNKEQIIMAKDARLLELERENKSLRLECMRLQRKKRCDVCFVPQHSLGDRSDSEDAPKKRRRANGIGNEGRFSSWPAHRRQEHEDVVTKVRTVIEQLHAENKKLKKAVTKQASVLSNRVHSMQRTMKIQNSIRERLEAQLQKLQHERSELKVDKLKLYTKTALPNSQNQDQLLELQVKEKDRQLLQVQQELARLRHHVIQLKLSIAHPSDGDTQSKHDQQQRMYEVQMRELMNENARLINELAAFDEDFFEEIEDLKYKYAQAVCDKRKLKKQLARVVDSVAPAASSSCRSKAKD